MGMIGIGQVIQYLRQFGMAPSPQVVGDVLAQLNPVGLVAHHRDRHTIHGWDGTADPPLGDRARWMQLTPAQLATWDRWTPAQRLAYLPRAGWLMRRHNAGQLTPAEFDEFATHPVPADGIGLATLEALAREKWTYWICKDGQIRTWQPFAPEAGRPWLEADPTHPYHWETVATRHRDQLAEMDADQAILEAVLAHLDTADGGPASPPPAVSLTGIERLGVNRP
jgi:hypothetical protein